MIEITLFLCVILLLVGGVVPLCICMDANTAKIIEAIKKAKEKGTP